MEVKYCYVHIFDELEASCSTCGYKARGSGDGTEEAREVLQSLLAEKAAEVMEKCSLKGIKKIDELDLTSDCVIDDEEESDVN